MGAFSGSPYVWESGWRCSAWVFGKKNFKMEKKGDTLYCISLIPLGGYVKNVLATIFEPDKVAKKRQSFFFFYTKPLHQRIAIVLAGPVMNLVLAILIASGMGDGPAKQNPASGGGAM